MFSLRLRIFTGMILSTLVVAHAETNTEGVETAAASQSVHKRPLTIVPEIGSTYFHITGADSGYKSASMVGASARFTTSNERLSWSAGIQYLQAGYKLKADWGILTLNLADISMDYLAVPLKAEYMISAPTTQGIRYFMTAGLTPAYLLSARYKDLVNSGEKEKGIRSEMNGLDTLLGVGFGGRYDTSIGMFDFTLEYQKGLMNISKEENLKNEGFMVKAGYNYIL